MAYLQSLIGRDGAVAYARGQKQTPVWVTGEVLMALAGKPLPLAPLAVPATKPARAPSRRLRRRHPPTTTRSSTSTTRSSTPKTPAGAAGHGAGGHPSAAGRPSSGQPADSATTASTGGPAGESVVIGAVVATAARTVAALRALM